MANPHKSIDHFMRIAGLAIAIILIPGSHLTSAGAAGADSVAPSDKPKETKELGGWRAPEAARAVGNPMKPTPESIARGQAVYEKSCIRCHGAEGHGDGKMAKILLTKPADLALRLPLESDGEIFWKVTEGKSPMPSFKKDLKPEPRWDVVNYLRRLIADPKPAAADSAATKTG
jgi:mono/diheme cytochrome c family protein